MKILIYCMTILLAIVISSILSHKYTQKKCKIKMDELVKSSSSLKKYSHLFETTGIGVIVKDSNDIVTEWSAGAYKQIGYTAEEMIGQSSDRYLLNSKSEENWKAKERLKRGEDIPLMEITVVHKDGHMLNCFASYTPILDSNGNYEGTVAIFYDFTYEKVSEQKVRSLAAIVAIADSGIIIKDKAGIVTEWNIGAENILGYTSEEMLGKTTHYYAPRESHQGIDDVQERLERGEHIAHVGVIRKHKDGQLVNCSASYTPIFDEEGKYDGSVAIFHDVTYEKISEDKARSLAAIVAIADSGIIIKDKEGCVTEWNIGAESILGYKAEEMLGKTTHYYAPEESHQSIDEVQDKLEQGIHTARAEVVRKHKDGTLIFCTASYTPIYDENQEYTGSVAIFHDISDKKQIEQELHDAVLAAEEASIAKSNFLANMSHEIRTPMNGIIGLTELALDSEEISDKSKDYLEKINISAEGLLNIINDILDISKIEAGKMELENIPFSLKEVFSICESVSLHKAQEKSISLFFYAEPLLMTKIIGDPTKLRQVLLNLLSNAIKFTNKGMVKLLTSINEVKNNKVSIHFEVKDSGIGMTDEQIKRIFEPFTQGDSSTTREYGGTGLGLAITKNMIEFMGGKLKVESILGVGSKFSFDLEFETSHELDCEKEETKLSEYKANRPIFQGNVLVCEDNEINQQVIREHLERVGLSVTIAADGKLGVEAVKEQMEKGCPFDLIFMDIHMPVMDGLDASRQLAELGNETPIVALTANAMVKDKETFLLNGMNDYLAKPFVAKTLWTCLEKYLVTVGSSSLQEECIEKNQSIIKADVLNVEKGIAQSAGDHQLYKKLLAEFVEKNKETCHQIELAMKAEDMKTAHRIAHTFKSVAGLLGAEELSKVASKVEKELQNGEKESAIEQLNLLKTASDDVFRVILENVEDVQKQEVNIGTLDVSKALELVEHLTTLLKKGSVKSTNLLPEITTTFGNNDEKVNLLIEQIEDFEFKTALQTLEEIKKQLEMDL